MSSYYGRQQPADVRFCVGCGHQGRSVAKFCSYCGTPLLVSSYPPLAPYQAEQTVCKREDDVRFNFADAIVFPFREKNWFAKLCVLPLVSFIPVFDIIVLSGWKLDIVRRMGYQRRQLLPDWDDVGSFFVDGLLLWIMTSIYLLPQIILLAMLGLSKRETVLLVLSWLYQTFISRSSNVSFLALLGQIGIAAATTLLLPVIYFMITYPLYRVALIRFAINRNPFVFLCFRSNLRFVFKHFRSIMALFFFEFITNSLMAFTAGLLVSTVIGAILIPIILLPVSYWINGYLFGTVAMQIYRNVATKNRRARKR